MDLPSTVEISVKLIKMSSGSPISVLLTRPPSQEGTEVGICLGKERQTPHPRRAALGGCWHSLTPTCWASAFQNKDQKRVLSLTFRNCSLSVQWSQRLSFFLHSRHSNLFMGECGKQLCFWARFIFQSILIFLKLSLSLRAFITFEYAYGKTSETYK